ncbi:HlyD family type I secretion periplasmic adaptor subunit [Alysiella crassa]|uniref:Membrane fusion protein (MFP) family protein n=1 Tax=Alysiella crassa TaxID=153491 RepID=A0A376BTZ0_9NEIS|nr:HlyD family type I secretion periplasmic adaptor subunit [Alysiella crassa]UOP05841.1 HlyD family type I secretion periplasmic adaptor subunit [Alysiella crassa]SSY80263.1 Hemolysin secretion protein D, chromosomal [Alysiella crassa]
MSLRFQAFKDFVSRYASAWRSVWSIRDQLDPPKRKGEELAFLPAHLELTDTPISAAPKWTARLIMLFSLLALIWSLVGKIDIVATAQGKTSTGSRSKTIQPLETAVVKAVHVRDGQQVKADEVLVELEAVGSDSDFTQSQQALQAAQLSKLRYEAVLKALDNQQVPYLNREAAKQLGIGDTAFQEAQVLAQNQYQAWAAQDAQLQSVLRGHQAELKAAQAQEQKLISLGVIERRKTADYAKLRQDQFISEHAYLEQHSKSVANQNDLDSTRSQIQQIQAAITQAQQNRTLNTQNLKRDTLDALRQATEQMEQYAGQTDKARQRQALMTLKSPVDGTVQELATYTIGGVVQAAQKVMVVVPNDEKMEVEALVLNKDIGFVEVGQDAVIKVESFPYTRYGYLTGKVKSVSHDAISHEDLGLVYTAIVSLDKSTLSIEGKQVNLTAGMNVSAEIKTGKRPVIDYLLSPLQTTVDESFKER